MRIQHNIMAMNAYRNYNNNTSALSKNLEKLASGYKINRAGDDAAGLAISEKMRAQITGLSAAQKNVKDGISLVKTAEGAMQEIQDMLNRMDYLATQSANGTYDDAVDRANLQKEVDALKTEINRIADASNFNGINLLDGSLNGSTAPKAGNVKLDSAKDVAITVTNDGTAQRTSARGRFELDLSKASWTAVTGNSGSTLTVEIAGHSFSVTASSKGDKIDGAAVAKAFISSLTNGAMSINGKDFNVTQDGNGKITFAGKDNEEMVATGSTKLMVTVTPTYMQQAAVQGGAGAGTPTNAVTSGNQAWSVGFSMLEEPVNATTTLASTATITLDDTLVQDGMTLKIGDETYTFAVGKDSKFKDKAGIIDLTDFEKTDSDRIKKAALRLTGAANNNKAVYVEANGQDGTIYLTEKIGGMDRDTWDMLGDIQKNRDATWKNGDKTAAFVQSQMVNPEDLPDSNGTAKANGGLTLQIGDTADDYNRISVVIGNMHVNAIGIADVDISTPDGAKDAIAKIKTAINNVSSVRGDLGAVQNRLEHTAKNLSVMAENIQDAESTIRDTDVAEEMMSYTKNNILIQSAQAMLAQANAVPQGVLQLLG